MTTVRDSNSGSMSSRACDKTAVHIGLLGISTIMESHVHRPAIHT